MLSFITEKQSSWDRLKAEERPIFIYGMGDGALKIMSVFRDKHITVAGIFASDDFVRGHSFEGYRVHKLSEIEEAVDDFVVVLAFAAGYQEIVDKVIEISEKHTLYVPDVPVVGRGLFTYEYCMENEDKIQQVYDSLADDYSRKVYANIINFKISGKIDYLSAVTTSKSDIYKRIIKPNLNEIYVDLGAYNGDTIKELLEFTQGRYASRNSRRYCGSPRLVLKYCTNGLVLLLTPVSAKKTWMFWGRKPSGSNVTPWGVMRKGRSRKHSKGSMPELLP